MLFRNAECTSARQTKQQIREDVAFSIGMKLQTESPPLKKSATTRKRQRAADFDAVVLATILPDSKRRRTKDKDQEEE